MSVERAKKSWEEWEPALRALDRRLARAVEELAAGREPADAGPAQDQALDRFAGMYLDSREVGRLAARAPAHCGAERPGETGEEPAPLTDAMAPGSRLSRFERALGLSPFEADVLLMAAASEIDPKYEKLYAFLQDDVNRKWPTVGLALGLLCAEPAVRLERLGAFGPSGRLARFGLIAMIPDPSGSQAPLPSRAFRIDEGVFHSLVRQDDGPHGLDAFAPAGDPPEKGAEDGPDDEPAAFADLVEAVRLAHGAGEPARVLLAGPRGSGKTTLVRRLASRHRLSHVAIDLGRLAAAPTATAQALGRSLAREARLRPTVVHLVADDPSLAAALQGDRPGAHAPHDAHGEGGPGEGAEARGGRSEGRGPGPGRDRAGPARPPEAGGGRPGDPGPRAARVAIGPPRGAGRVRRGRAGRPARRGPPPGLARGARRPGSGRRSRPRRRAGPRRDVPDRAGPDPGRGARGRPRRRRAAGERSGRRRAPGRPRRSATWPSGSSRTPPGTTWSSPTTSAASSTTWSAALGSATAS